MEKSSVMKVINENHGIDWKGWIQDISPGIKSKYLHLYKNVGCGFFREFFEAFEMDEIPALVCPSSTSFWIKDGMSLGVLSSMWPRPFLARDIQIIPDYENLSYLPRNIILLGRANEKLFKSKLVKEVSQQINEHQFIKFPEDLDVKKIILSGKLLESKESAGVPILDYAVIGKYRLQDIDKVCISIQGLRSLGTYGASFFITSIHSLIEIDNHFKKLSNFAGLKE